MSVIFVPLRRNKLSVAVFFGARYRLAEEPEADPRLAGGITCPGWPGSTWSSSQEELDRVPVEEEAWNVVSALRQTLRPPGGSHVKP